MNQTTNNLTPAAGTALDSFFEAIRRMAEALDRLEAEASAEDADQT